uniref:lytic transglycosylase domain-containing protein n=1 Tax=uncultured Sphingorhabdus sp. TaxID=1686106 RepID=UPI002607B5E4
MRWNRIRFAAFLALALFGGVPGFAQDAAEQVQPLRIDIASHVAEASQRFGIPEQWIWAVMRVESAGRIDATSHAGAMGLMQVMPGTWANLTAQHGLGNQPYDPRANIMAGAGSPPQKH